MLYSSQPNKERSMLAFEALTQTPTTATLANAGEATEQANGLSFEEFLKGLSKEALMLTPKGDVVLPAKEHTENRQLPDDPKSVLLSLLQNSENKEETNRLPTLSKKDEKQLLQKRSRSTPLSHKRSRSTS